MTHAFRAIDTPQYILGEGPAWDAGRRMVSWIDIEDGLVVEAPWNDRRLGELTTRDVGGVVGCALPIGDGRFLLGLESWIGVLHPTGRIEKSRAIIPPNRRFNDGKIDPQGRLVIGSLRRASTDDQQQLLRIEPDRTITLLDDDLHQSNGLGWSPDGEVFYNADTAIGTVFARSYRGGVAGARTVFAEVGGMPDGLTVDSDGNLWVTIFDAGRIDCYSADGSRRPERTISLPGLHPASVEFVGPELDHLLITTGFPRLEDPAIAALREDRDGVVLLAGTRARGLPSPRWNEMPLPR